MDLGAAATDVLVGKCDKSKLLLVLNDESESSDSEPARATAGTPSLLLPKGFSGVGVEINLGLSRAEKDFRSLIYKRTICLSSINERIALFFFLFVDKP